MTTIAQINHKTTTLDQISTLGLVGATPSLRDMLNTLFSAQNKTKMVGAISATDLQINGSGSPTYTELIAEQSAPIVPGTVVRVRASGRLNWASSGHGINILVYLRIDGTLYALDCPLLYQAGVKDFFVDGEFALQQVSGTFTKVAGVYRYTIDTASKALRATADPTDGPWGASMTVSAGVLLSGSGTYIKPDSYRVEVLAP